MSDQEIHDRVEGDPDPDPEPDSEPDAKALVGAPARELKADLSALLRDARALLADVDALDARIKAAVSAAPSLDGPSGSARLVPLTGAGVTVLDDIDRRARLTGSDPELVGWARSIAGWGTDESLRVRPGVRLGVRLGVALDAVLNLLI